MADAKEKDFIFQQQGQKAFMKVKMDWAQYGKVHLSFVSHSGKPACKQIANVEAALKVTGADSALYLAEAVLNGAMSRRRAASLEKQKTSGAKYADPVFSSMGGTPSSRSKNGKCTFRQVLLVPGTSADFAFQVIEAEGEETATGGIAMKKGATTTRITVGIKLEELVSMASIIKLAWGAYLIASGTCTGISAYQQEHDSQAMRPESVQPAATQPAAAAKTSPTPAKNVSNMAYVVYDTIGETFEVASNPEATLTVVQQAIRTLHSAKSHPAFSRKDNTEYEATKAKILAGDANDDIPSINLYAADGSSCELIVVCRQIHN